MIPGFMMPPGLMMPPELMNGGGGPPPVTFKAQSASTLAGTSWTLPASIVAGDLIIIVRSRDLATANTVYSGYTEVAHGGISLGDGDGQSSRIMRKIAVAGDAGASLASVNQEMDVALVFAAAASSVIHGTPQASSHVSQAPANITLANPASAPAIIVGVYGSNNQTLLQSAAKSASPAWTSLLPFLNTTCPRYIGYSIRQDAPGGGTTMSMGDGGSGNFMCGNSIRIIQ